MECNLQRISLIAIWFLPVPCTNFINKKKTLLQLYVSLVRPHVEYAAPVWDPHLAQDINMLENVQKFGLRVCSKQWDTGYSELLNMCNLSTLENHRLYLKLCHLFKIVNGLCYFPSGVIVPRHNPSHAMRPLILSNPLPGQIAFSIHSSRTLCGSGTTCQITWYVLLTTLILNIYLDHLLSLIIYEYHKSSLVPRPPPRLSCGRGLGTRLP